MDEATRGNWGENFLRIWMDSFLVLRFNSVYCKRCSLMVGGLFLFSFFRSWDNLFLEAFKLDTSHFDHRRSPASEDESWVPKFMFLA